MKKENVVEEVLCGLLLFFVFFVLPFIAHNCF